MPGFLYNVYSRTRTTRSDTVCAHCVLLMPNTCERCETGPIAALVCTDILVTTVFKEVEMNPVVV